MNGGGTMFGEPERKLNPEQTLDVLLRTWWAAFEKAAMDLQGIIPREFCTKAYEHAAENFLKILANKYGIIAERAETIDDAVNNYIHVGIHAGLFENVSQFELKSVSEDELEITVRECPYQGKCGDLLHDGLPLTSLSCARLGCFRGAVIHLAGLDCSFKVTKCNPLENFCQGILERK